MISRLDFKKFSLYIWDLEPLNIFRKGACTAPAVAAHIHVHEPTKLMPPLIYVMYAASDHRPVGCV